MQEATEGSSCDLPPLHSVILPKLQNTGNEKWIWNESGWWAIYNMLFRSNSISWCHNMMIVTCLQIYEIGGWTKWPLSFLVMLMSSGFPGDKNKPMKSFGWFQCMQTFHLWSKDNLKPSLLWGNISSWHHRPRAQNSCHVLGFSLLLWHHVHLIAQTLGQSRWKSLCQVN